MKRIITSLIFVLVTAVTLITTTLAWYTKIDKIESEIDASSGHIVINHTYDNFTKTEETYSISNVAFFDIHNEESEFSELDYLDIMACKVSINIENKSSTDTTVKVSFASTKLIISAEDKSNTTLSSSYIDCILLENELGKNDSLKNHLSDDKALTFDLTLNETKTIYLYLYGVEELDDTDEDFLSKTHSFSLSFEAVKKED